MIRLTSDFGQETQQIDAAPGDAGIGRERDHGGAARPRQLRGRRNGSREQRTQNHFRALAERLLRDLLGALRAAAVILDQELDVGILKLGQRHLGRVLHRLRGDAGIAGCRQRQDQPDLDLAVADRKRLLLRPGGTCIGLRRGGRTERIGELAERLLHAGASAEQRGAENQADRRPPGRAGR